MNAEMLIGLAVRVVIVGVCAWYLSQFFSMAKKTWVSYLFVFWAIGIIISQAIQLISKLSGK